jgi:pyridine nucleotide-disulfide oxidoreductase family protein
MPDHRLVLVGGGHTHVQVMRALAERPEPGLSVTLVTDRAMTPYSGMLPGHVAGFYARDEMHIDLVRLARVTGTALVEAPAIGLDRKGKRLFARNAAPIPYDTLSLNVGITPDLSGIAGAERFGIAVKPIGGFLARLEGLLAQAGRPDGARRIVIVGGGPAGVELAFALRTRLADAPAEGRPFWIGIVSAEGVAPSLNAGVRRRIRAALVRRRIAVVEGFRAVEVNGEGVRAADGRFIAADAVLISTAARAPSWLSETDLPLAADGSVKTARTLAVIDDDSVFAVGDCAVVVDDPRAKAGVFAVRQGPPLTDNLRRRVAGQAPLPHAAQRAYLAILMTGDGSAIAGRGAWLAFEGRWVWRWKDWIDRRFMARFNAFRR